MVKEGPKIVETNLTIKKGDFERALASDDHTFEATLNSGAYPKVGSRTIAIGLGGLEVVNIDTEAKKVRYKIILDPEQKESGK